MFAWLRIAFDWICYNSGRVYVIVMESTIPGGDVNQALADWNRRKGRPVIEGFRLNEILKEQKATKHLA